MALQIAACLEVPLGTPLQCKAKSLVFLVSLLRGMFKGTPVKVAYPTLREANWEHLFKDLWQSCSLGNYQYFGYFSSQLRIGT